MAKAAKSEDPTPFVPLAPAPLHIVLALNRGERHGYGIIKEVEYLSDGVIKMGPGSLYGSIKKLVAQSIIEESDVRPDPALDDERRKYYRLTGLGRAVCAAELERLSNLVARTQRSAPARLLGGTA